jgi:hypothetical protein
VSISHRFERDPGGWNESSRALPGFFYRTLYSETDPSEEPGASTGAKPAEHPSLRQEMGDLDCDGKPIEKDQIETINNNYE